MSKRLIFINRYFYPDESATSQMLSDLVFGLESADYQIEVLTSRQRIDDSDANLPPAERVANILINRVWTTRWGRAYLPGRAIDYLTFYLSATLVAARRARRGDVIIAKTDPPMIGAPMALVAWLKGAKLINWWQDIYPEVAERLGVSAIKPVSGLMRWLRHATCKAATRNVAIGRCMREFLLAAGAPVDSVVVIPNWADDQSITPLAPEDNNLRSDWGLTDIFVVGYSGNMGRGHEFNALLQAAGNLRDDQRIQFLFIGSGARKQEIQDKVARLGLSNVSFQPFQPREQLGLSLTVPDVHIVSLRPEMCGLIVPSKFYGVLAAGRPLIFLGPEGSEIAQVISEYECGFVCSEINAERITQIVKELVTTDQLAQQQGIRARQAVEERYSKAKSILAWQRIIEDTLG